ncbi:MAG: tRNA (adenosine(37)-N6)-threonylcarbamoyltransferase complex ATPase subunit type 1 TsaE [Eubacteriales bacterium]
MNLISNCSQDTYAIGLKLGQQINAPIVVCIQGQMGAGKTVFSQGILRGLGVTEKYITSPTYTLVNAYEVNKHQIYHFDVYRIVDFDELRCIGFDEYMDGSSTVIIEWADRISQYLHERNLWVHIHCHYEDVRKLSITGLDPNMHKEFKRWEDKGENFSH